MAADRTRILVIKLGALGDFVQALGPFAAIRKHHGGASITLMTTQPFAEFAGQSGYFDTVWVAARPGRFQGRRWMALRRRLRADGYHRIYDLQTSDRSSFLFRLFWPGPYPEWSGIARGCSHPHANPDRDLMHTLDRQAEQLTHAGIAAVPLPDLSWADTDTSLFGVRAPYALMVPGGAAHRLEKRWPVDHYGALARKMEDVGVQPVLLGAAGERDLLAVVAGICPGALNLAGGTTLADVVTLARRAVCAIGNDTGPMHLAALSDCRSVVLFSRHSDPDLCRPRGRQVAILESDPLSTLAVDEVARRCGLPGARP